MDRPMIWKVFRYLSSARRHKISEERIAYVIVTCPMPQALVDPEPGEEDVLLFLAPDRNGVPLEVLAIEVPDGGLVVFHAMKVARKNAAEYDEVMR
jgi:hypothetical protein